VKQYQRLSDGVSDSHAGGGGARAIARKATTARPSRPAYAHHGRVLLYLCSTCRPSRRRGVVISKEVVEGPRAALHLCRPADRGAATRVHRSQALHRLQNADRRPVQGRRHYGLRKTPSSRSEYDSGTGFPRGAALAAAESLNLLKELLLIAVSLCRVPSALCCWLAAIWSHSLPHRG